MKKRLIKAAVIASAFAMLLTACGSGSGKYEASTTASEAYYDNGYSDYDYSYEVAEGSYDSFGTSNAETVTDSASQSNKIDNSRKLIKTVNLDVETLEFDTLVSTLETQTVNFGGYVESQNTWNGSRYNYSYSTYVANRNASFTIRIPADQLAGFLESFSGLCNITNKSESVEDITLSYVDLESQKDALLIEQQNLLDMLDQADDIDSMLMIEDRLTTIRYQLQSMESQLRTYDNKVNYSTIYIDVTEVKEFTPEPEPEPETVWERISKGFTKNLSSVGTGLTDFFVWFISALPHLLLWGAIIFGIVMLVRAIVRANIKKSRKRAQERAQQAAMQSPYGQNPAQMTPQQIAQMQAQQVAQMQAQQAAQMQAQQAAQMQAQQAAQMQAQQVTQNQEPQENSTDEQ